MSTPWTAPDVSVFKRIFKRDFAYASPGNPDDDDFVTDDDLNQAFSDALQNFKTSLFPTDDVLPNGLDSCTNAFLLLAAFYLAVTIQNSFGGISAKTNFPINSKSVAGVAVTFTIPERYTKSPFLSQYTQNGYGMKYLSLVLPRLVGNVGLICGTTTYS